VDGIQDTIQLRDGTRLLIRTPSPDDADALLAFLGSLPSESPRLSFVCRASDLEAMARWAANPDGTDHLAIVALDFQGRLVGHVACSRIYGRRGEVAVDVDQGCGYHGLANALLKRITRDAKRQGMDTLIAEVNPEADDVSFVPNGNVPATGADS
jgi:RimJ/RimL family protein N-acetyltransferase